MRKKNQKSYEQRLREQLLDAGISIPETKPQLVTISGQTTGDVRPEFRRIALALQDKINMKVREVKISSPLSAVVFFPTILDPAMGTFPDFIIHKRDRSVFVGLNIDHGTWVSSSTEEKIDLLRNNLRKSIEKIKQTYLSPDDRAVLLAVI